MFYMLDDSSEPKRRLNISDYVDRYDFRSPYDDKFTWFEGMRFTETAPEPFEIKLRPNEKDHPDHGPLIPSYYNHKIGKKRHPSNKSLAQTPESMYKNMIKNF